MTNSYNTFSQASERALGRNSKVSELNACSEGHVVLKVLFSHVSHSGLSTTQKDV